MFIDDYILPADDDGADRGRIFAGAAIAAVLLWLAVMLWLVRGEIGAIGPVALVQLLAALCVVPALIGIIWLLAMRTSRAEAARFGVTARAMQAESARLEQAVAATAQTIDRNRRHLADQVDTLMTMGETAHQFLGAIGEGFATEIERADAHTRSLVAAADATQTSLGVLLASLPRAHAETEAMADQLERAGLSASEHAGALDAQIGALAARGREADAVASGAAQRLAAHIIRMEATSETAGARLEAVTETMSAAVDALLGRTADAVDEARKGIAAQGDAVLAMVSANQAALDGATRASAEAIADRIAGVDSAIAQVARRLEDQRASGEDILGSLGAGLDQVETRINTLHHHGVERTQLLAASISALGGSADAMTEALRSGEAMAGRTIGTTESLLIALDAAAREIDETLPDALSRLDRRVADSKAIVVAAKPELLALVTAAESTHDAIEAIAGVIAEQRSVVDRLSNTLLDTLASGRAKADALGQMVDETIDRTNSFSEEAAPRLVEALLRVRETATAAADTARHTLAQVIPDAAQALELASSAALRRATGDTVDRQIQAIGDATDAAVDATTRATERLAAQVDAIAQQTAVVETRLEEARNDRETADRDTFARRVSLLIESLNSASIDIAKAFAPEVADSAWAAYLKGDRGVFTRRAVRILDANDARAIANLYDDDAGFREMVNRYIHDFESMLRAILAQRDGSPLGVTLLSSDMGKLYVALAQAIERLR
ncbi:conserved hypothetical protein [Sphingomonas sp. T1]|uniref:hypothetical protein n=1 Tax=Sphingomonas sp. T1 TaxID=2653172 RepID=UPI0012F3B14C|nr:hypothetical protein [Sphingomonas sp. T1]VXC93227.1 conserved hypothetical protein [Sphingomonas sp. T1]